jgi:hypothetical protein
MSEPNVSKVEPCGISMGGRPINDWCERCSHLLLAHVKDTTCSICEVVAEVRHD